MAFQFITFVRCSRQAHPATARISKIYFAFISDLAGIKAVYGQETPARRASPQLYPIHGFNVMSNMRFNEFAILAITIRISITPTIVE